MYACMYVCIYVVNVYACYIYLCFCIIAAINNTTFNAFHISHMQETPR